MTKRTFRILNPDVTPTGALTWETPPLRPPAIRRWRRRVFKNFKSLRVTRVAWVLADLFHSKTGYAYAGDKYIATEAELSVRQVEKAIATLDQAKAIIRVHCVIDGKDQRRIYPLGQPSTTDGSNRPLRTRPQRTDRYRKKERHYAAASTREATRSLAEAWRGPGCHEEIDPKDEPTNKGG